MDLVRDAHALELKAGVEEIPWRRFSTMEDHETRPTTSQIPLDNSPT